MLLTRPPLSAQPKPGISCDLHALGTPPTFILSQDQTLQNSQTSTRPLVSHRANLNLSSRHRPRRRVTTPIGAPTLTSQVPSVRRSFMSLDSACCPDVNVPRAPSGPQASIVPIAANSVNARGRCRVRGDGHREPALTASPVERLGCSVDTVNRPSIRERSQGGWRETAPSLA